MASWHQANKIDVTLARHGTPVARRFAVDGLNGLDRSLSRPGDLTTQTHRMRSITRQPLVNALALLSTVFVPLLPLRASDIVTNWVAFNDHRRGPVVTNRTWGTAANVTTNDMRVGPGGSLINFLNGQPLPVTMTVTTNGAPDDFGTMVYPYGNTPASNLFCGVVDLSNQNSGIGVRFSSQSGVTLTFNNLNPDKHYVFRGTSARGGKRQ